MSNDKKPDKFLGLVRQRYRGHGNINLRISISRLFFYSLLILISMLLVSCYFPPLENTKTKITLTFVDGRKTDIPKQAPTPTLKPTQTPQELYLPGRLLVIVNLSLYEIFKNKENNSVHISTIANDVHYEDISSDRRNLVNDDGKNFYIQSIETGEKKYIDVEVSSPFRNEVSWAPDNKKFSLAVYPDPNSSTRDELVGLYIVDISGKIEKIYTPKSGQYGQLGSSGGGKKYYSQFNSGLWLDDEYLIFSGFEGPMPNFISGTGSEPMEPNTLYVVSMKTLKEIEPFSKQWEDYQICHSDTGNTYVLVDGKKLYGMRVLNPELIWECFDCPELSFLRQSCGLYQNLRISNPKVKTFLFYLEGDFDSPVTYDYDNKLYKWGISWDGVFIGDPKNYLIPIGMDDNPWKGHVDLSLLDLKNGTISDLKSFDQDGSSHVTVVDWLPE